MPGTPPGMTSQYRCPVPEGTSVRARAAGQRASPHSNLLGDVWEVMHGCAGQLELKPPLTFWPPLVEEPHQSTGHLLV